MNEYIDLELDLARYEQNASGYSAEVTRRVPGDNSDNRREATEPLRFDFDKLRAATSDMNAYGQLLTEQLFAAKELAEEFSNARSGAYPVRFRLTISPSAPDLHALRWETLRDPKDLSAPLLTNENLLFSRHVFTNGRPVKLRSAADLRALVVVASPSDLGKVITGGAPLAPIDHNVERTAAEKRLRGFRIDFLTNPGDATLENILAALSKTDYDVLYLVCHGKIVRDLPYLLLEEKDGTRDDVLSLELVRGMRDLRNPPPLVALASCHSGGDAYTSTGEIVARFGSSLAVEAGIPVVIAMQGDVSLITASTFLEVFFDHLRQHGEVDWAAAVARRAVKDKHDAWMPVLYMRLLHGRLWKGIVPESQPGAPSFGRWKQLFEHIRRGKCTPIIGYGVYEEVFGTAASLAERWAESYRYPLREGDELPKIAQYLAVNHDDKLYPQYQLTNHLRREVARRAREQGVQLRKDSLDGMLTEAWKEVAKDNDPHRVLANLPCALYLTANLSSVLETAIDEAGREPRPVICNWRNDDSKDEPPADIDFEKPIVYHLFGHFDQEDSIVLTEDNYFDYLVGTATAKGPFVEMVRGRLNASALILLGFQVTEWSLRVLFRSIMKSGGKSLRENYTHVAVQVDPNQVGVAEPDRVFAYLSAYLDQEKITVFPGTVGEFVDEFVRRWQHEYGENLLTQRAKRLK
ncbi:MAG TPA: CHAT domain-containing protein [Thermoanaerobaculia bacterium]|nr:CHAT domain-containing protein [Thermoanaerobaculia bacterium]